MNGVYLRKKSLEEFSTLAVPFVVRVGLSTEENIRNNWQWFQEIMALVQERVHFLDEVPPYVDFFFQEKLTYDEKAVRKFLTTDIKPFIQQVIAKLATCEWIVSSIEKEVRTLIDEMSLNSKQALLTLRVAISGKAVSPPLFESIFLLGREKVLSRLTQWT